MLKSAQEHAASLESQLQNTVSHLEESKSVNSQLLAEKEMLTASLEQKAQETAELSATKENLQSLAKQLQETHQAIQTERQSRDEENQKVWLFIVNSR